MNFGNFAPFKLARTLKRIQTRYFSEAHRKPPWKVLFFGSDQFSVYSLQTLTKEYRLGRIINELEVVTNIKGKPNPVRVFSNKENLKLHPWPLDLANCNFDVGLVVSFGHLIPKHVIERFPFGMLNVHASLLPRWRGAAPIIYAIAKGDKETGITIMRIKPDKFDVGDIISQESVKITSDMKMPELHKKLGTLGAKHLVNTLNDLPKSLDNARPQASSGITKAPKISPDFAKVDWKNMPSQEVLDLDRALHGMLSLTTNYEGISVKLLDVKKDSDETLQNVSPGFIEYDKTKRVLRVLCSDSKFVTVANFKVPGKKVMSAVDFYNGYIKNKSESSRFFS